MINGLTNIPIQNQDLKSPLTPKTPGSLVNLNLHLDLKSPRNNNNL